jgi:hypothetical protein
MERAMIKRRRFKHYLPHFGEARTAIFAIQKIE